MQNRLFLFIGWCLFATVACGGSTNGDAPQGPVENGPGTAQFSVTSDRPVAGSSTGASYSISASFTIQPSCTTTTVGACTVNPCYQSSSSGNASVAAPNAGQVTFVGAGVSSLALDPQSDGNYAGESVIGQLPWQTGGETVSFQWAHFPGNAGQPGDNITLASPPYIALATGSAFAGAISVLERNQDLMVSWTSDTAPTETDQVIFDVNSSSVQVYCIFGADSGAGGVPAAALGFLDAGPGVWSITSKGHAFENINDGDGAWGMNFNISALARASYGLARGSVTIQ